MPNQYFVTADGSHSLISDRFGEAYHSKHGAIQESNHVFLKNGLHPLLQNKESVSILEIGLGTGLNAILTYLASLDQKREVLYTALEAYPISESEAEGLNYRTELKLDKMSCEVFKQIHSSAWEMEMAFNEYFSFRKLQSSLQDVEWLTTFDLVYFDAFAPTCQPEMWTEQTFQKIYNAMNPYSSLVTYCAKGIVKRTLKNVGFRIETLPGPPGKREMTRAIREN